MGRWGVCKVTGCARPVKTRRYCGLHAERVRRHGDPTVSNSGSGEANPRWRGDAVTYSGAHMRVRAARGPAAEHACVDCGHPAAQWSYDRADPDEQAGPDGPYSADVQHYQPRCVPCHKRFDLAGRERGEVRRDG